MRRRTRTLKRWVMSPANLKIFMAGAAVDSNKTQEKNPRFSLLLLLLRFGIVWKWRERERESEIKGRTDAFAEESDGLGEARGR